MHHVAGSRAAGALNDDLRDPPPDGGSEHQDDRGVDDAADATAGPSNGDPTPGDADPEATWLDQAEQQTFPPGEPHLWVNVWAAICCDRSACRDMAAASTGDSRFYYPMNHELHELAVLLTGSAHRPVRCACEAVKYNVAAHVVEWNKEP